MIIDFSAPWKQWRNRAGYIWADGVNTKGKDWQMPTLHCKGIGRSDFVPEGKNTRSGWHSQRSARHVTQHVQCMLDSGNFFQSLENCEGPVDKQMQRQREQANNVWELVVPIMVKKAYIPILRMVMQRISRWMTGYGFSQALDKTKGERVPTGLLFSWYIYI